MEKKSSIKQKPDQPSTRPADPRPTKQRDFQISCLQTIITFLVRKLYPHPISLPQLLQPDIKAFWTITDFTAKKLDRSLRCTNERELTELMTFLEYPYPVNKQILMGASSSWGNLLGLMAWLVECVDLACDVDYQYGNCIEEYIFEAYDYFFESRDYKGLREELFEVFKEETEKENLAKMTVREKIVELEIEKSRLEIEELDDFELKIGKLTTLNKTYCKTNELKRESIQRLENKRDLLEKELKYHFQVDKIDENLPLILKERLEALEKSVKEYSEHEKSLSLQIQSQNSQLSELQHILEEISESPVESPEKLKTTETEISQQESEIASLNQQSESLKSTLLSYQQQTLSIKEKLKKSEEEHKNLLKNIRTVITEDTQIIANHGNKIAEWLQEIHISSLTN